MSDTGNITSNVCSMGELVWLGLVIGPVCVLGYIGNTLCLLVLYRARNQSSVTIVLLKALAASDLLYLLLYSIMQLWPRLLPGLYILAYMHAYVWPIVSILLSITTWLMVVLTGHRYIVVCHPLQTRHRCTLARVRMQISLVCILAAVIDIPRFFELRVLQRNGTEVLDIHPTWLYQDYYYNLLYKNGLMLLYRKLLPLGITIAMTVRILKVLHKAKRARFQLSRRVPDRRRVAPHEQRITKVLLTVVVVFILCQMPGAVYPVLRMSLQYMYMGCGTVYYYLYIIADGLTLVNSAVNFLIYMLCSSEFRQGFYKLWRGSSRRLFMTTATLRHPRTSIDMADCDKEAQSVV